MAYNFGTTITKKKKLYNNCVNILHRGNKSPKENEDTALFSRPFGIFPTNVALKNH